MKAFLYFIGSIFRWAPQKPGEFFLLHGYVLMIYGLVYAFDSLQGFILTVGLCTPLLVAIGQGLPLDCLDYESAIRREFPSKQET